MNLDDANTLAQQLNDQQLDKRLPAASGFDPSAVGNLLSAAADGTSVVVDLPEAWRKSRATSPGHCSK